MLLLAISDRRFVLEVCQSQEVYKLVRDRWGTTKQDCWAIVCCEYMTKITCEATWNDLIFHRCCTINMEKLFSSRHLDTWWLRVVYGWAIVKLKGGRYWHTASNLCEDIAITRIGNSRNTNMIVYPIKLTLRPTMWDIPLPDHIHRYDTNLEMKLMSLLDHTHTHYIHHTLP